MSFVCKANGVVFQGRYAIGHKYQKWKHIWRKCRCCRQKLAHWGSVQSSKTGPLGVSTISFPSYMDPCTEPRFCRPQAHSHWQLTKVSLLTTDMGLYLHVTEL